MDLSEAKDSLQVFVNPVITQLEGMIETEEGLRNLDEIAAVLEDTPGIRGVAFDGTSC